MYFLTYNWINFLSPERKLQRKLRADEDTVASATLRAKIFTAPLGSSREKFLRESLALYRSL
ncbi:MAG: hypothetical protein ACD_56C00130G0001 [uncultured bacterium]|nr:MAG: hypothetical protein ACD_56C00130G0001 [uncultured bacterium]